MDFLRCLQKNRVHFQGGDGRGLAFNVFFSGAIGLAAIDVNLGRQTRLYRILYAPVLVQRWNGTRFGNFCQVPQFDGVLIVQCLKTHI